MYACVSKKMKLRISIIYDKKCILHRLLSPLQARPDQEHYVLHLNLVYRNISITGAMKPNAQCSNNVYCLATYPLAPSMWSRE